MNNQGGNHVKIGCPPLPKYINMWFMFTNIVNITALVYSIFSWYYKKDFSFVSWFVIGWSLFSSFINIFMYMKVGSILNNYTQAYSCMFFTCIWILIGILKMSVDGFPKINE